jgi:hypothetical protein
LLVSTDAKIELQHKIFELEGKMAEAGIKMDELAQSSEEAWEVIKDGAEVVWANFKQILAEAKSKFDK